MPKGGTPEVARIRGHIGVEHLRGNYALADEYRRQMRVQILREHIARDLDALDDDDRADLSGMILGGA